MCHGVSNHRQTLDRFSTACVGWLKTTKALNYQAFLRRIHDWRTPPPPPPPRVSNAETFPRHEVNTLTEQLPTLYDKSCKLCSQPSFSFVLLWWILVKFIFRLIILWWRHDIERLSALLAISERNPAVSLWPGSYHKGSVTWSFDILLLVWIRCSTNGLFAGDMGHLNAHVTSLLCNDTNYVRTTANSGPIVGLRPANERWRYLVTLSLIGWAQA